MAISNLTLNRRVPVESDSLSDSEPTFAAEGRSIKVSYLIPDSRGHGRPRQVLAPMPFLRLQGRWLARAGFGIGSNVRVLVTPRRLVLEVMDTEPTPEQAGQRDLWRS